MTAIPKRPIYALLLYPFEICLSLGLAIIAAASFAQEWTFSSTVNRNLGLAIAAGWQAGLLLGCVLILFGLFLRPRVSRTRNREANLMKLRGVEAAGCIGVAMSMFIFSFVLGNYVGQNTFVLSVHGLLGAAFVLRVIALNQADKYVLDTVRALPV